MLRSVRRLKRFDLKKPVRFFSKDAETTLAPVSPKQTTLTLLWEILRLWKSNVKTEKKKIAILATLLTLVTITGTIISSYEPTQKILREVISPNIKNAKVEAIVPENEFADRASVSEQLEQAMTSTNRDRKYTVVYGPKGVGKSAIVLNVASKKKSVMKICISDTCSKEELSKIMLEAFGASSYGQVALSALIDALKSLNAKGITPTIVYDCGSSSNPVSARALKAVDDLAKETKYYCRSIIVLSDANAVVQLYNNSDRQEHIFITEMEESEARSLLEKRITLKEAKQFTEEELRYIFDNIGTYPLKLVDLASWRKENPTRNVEDFVKSEMVNALEALDAFNLTPILKALKENPDGVKPSMFKGCEYKGVNLADPQEVCSYLKLKNWNVILYRTDIKMYQLQSTALKTALKTYEPVINYDAYIIPNTKIKKPVEQPETKTDVKAEIKKPWYWPW